MPAVLHHTIFVTGQIPQSGRGPLPDGSRRMWSPITSTLILGRRDAVLVDAPLTTAQAGDVGDWVSASGRTLRQIYITHGHGDHSAEIDNAAVFLASDLSSVTTGSTVTADGGADQV